ncbi:MAG: hypothetical protein Q8Q07_07730 [Dehalococcoidales bacterium]|nr:hypothetical protein [Dehalococcoidales bacterium]
MITAKRRVFKAGGSKAVTLPKSCRIEEAVTMAGGTRLILVNTTGQIREGDLVRFCVRYLEPMFWDWWRREHKKGAHDDLSDWEGRL